MRTPAAQPLAAWLAAGLAALGALLALPIWPTARADRPALEAVLLDVSASVLRPRPGWLPWARRELAALAGRAADEGRELVVLTYADGVATVFGPGDPTAFARRLAGAEGRLFDPLAAELPDLGTDLVAALERAGQELLAPGRPPGRAVLLGADGAGPGPCEPALARLAAGGVVLEHRPPPPAARVDRALTELRLPRAPAVGSQVVALAEVELRGATAGAPDEVTLEVELEGPDGRERRQVTAPVPPGAGAGARQVAVALDLGRAPDGRTRVGVRVLGDPGAPDPFPENDRLERTLVAGERRTVGVVAEPPDLEEARAWTGGFGPDPGLQWRHLTPEALPGALAELDALLAWDLRPGPTLRAALEGRVRAGLGFGALLGWRAVAGGTDPRTGFLGPGPLVPGFSGVGSDPAPAPLSALEPAGREREPRAVLLLVDGSGSMAGAAFEQVRRAAAELAAAVPSEDRLALRFFTSVLQPPVSLDVGAADGPRGEGADGGGAGRDRTAVARRVLEARRPSGPTALLASLEALAAERAADPRREALVLLLTDGREEDDPIREHQRRRALVASFAASRTELRALAIGERAELATLEPLVRAPEHLVRVEPGADLAELVVRTALVEELERGREPLTRGSGPLVRAVLGPLDPASTGVGTSVDQRLPARAAAGAEAAWLAPDGAAVLGLARSGAGRLATLALLPAPGWSPALAADPTPLTPVLRWLASGPRVRAPRARLAHLDDGGVELVLDRLGPAPPTLLAVRLLDRPDGSVLEATPPVAPGREDERRVRLPADAADLFRLTADGSPRTGTAAGSAPRGPTVEVRLPGGVQVLGIDRPPPREAGPPRPLPALPRPRSEARAPGRAAHPAAAAALWVALAAASGFGIAAVLGARAVKPDGDARR